MCNGDVLDCPSPNNSSIWFSIFALFNWMDRHGNWNCCGHGKEFSHKNLVVPPFLSRLYMSPPKLRISSILTIPFPFPSSLLKRLCSSLDNNMANAASGMAVDNECKVKFLELKAKRNYRFIIFKIEAQQVVVDKVGSPDETYDHFTASLPSDECRYAVFDFDFTTDENCQKSKIFFIAWSPDTSRVRSKMVYASSKDRFRRELEGVQVELQATDASEISFDNIISRAL